MSERENKVAVLASGTEQTKARIAPQTVFTQTEICTGAGSSLRFCGGSLRHPSVYAGDVVHFYFEGLQGRVLVQRRLPEDVLEVLQRHGEHEVAPGDLQKKTSWLDDIHGHPPKSS